MSDSQVRPLTNDSISPKALSALRIDEIWLGGNLTSLVIYGMLVVLFFRCMSALFNPAHRRGERVKWGLVFYTVMMFSLVTAYTAMNLHMLSMSINHPKPRSRPGIYEYLNVVYFDAIAVIPRAVFRLTNLSADGLLLYRCYLFYSMNLWVIAFPFLMYLGSVVTGILSLEPLLGNASSGWSIPWLSISLSLNVLLTLMIVVRLVLRCRNVRFAMGSPTRPSGLYKTIATMLIESSALFAVSSLLVIIMWAVSTPAGNTFARILAQTQVIASLLIIQRVANRSALTSETITHGNIDQFKAGGNALPGGQSMNFMVEYGISSVEPGIGVETVIDIHRDKV